MSITGFVCFDSLSEDFVSPVGAVAAGQEVFFKLRLSKRSGAHSPRLLIYEADLWDRPVVVLPMQLLRDEAAQCWYSVRWTPLAERLMFYRFDAVDETDARRSLMKNPFNLGVWGENARHHWQMTVYRPDMKPDFLAGGLIYQIFPDRFFNSGSAKHGVPEDRVLRFDEWGGMPQWEERKGEQPCCNDYFGGDLEGIRQKLSYLHSLGVTALYLNPIFEAHSNHRYNTADYTKIDPLLGTEEDFAHLCADAQKLGISVLLDGVFSHTGSDSLYFNREGRYQNGAFHDPASPYRSWYRFDDSKTGYKSWWGIESLPEVSEEEPSYLSFIAGKNGVIDRWMGLGAAGWRLDVADELPDTALDAICEAIKRNNPDAPVIGEVWEDASNKSSYGVRRRYLLGGQLTSVTNYPLTEAVLAFVRDGDVFSLADTLFNQQQNYPPPIRNSLMNPLSSHDIPRVLTALGKEPATGASRRWQVEHNTMTDDEYTRAKRMFRLAAVLQYTLPGVPCLYYGDEAGLYGYRDPFNRGCYPWGSEDSELAEFFMALGSMRKTSPCLATGSFSAVQLNESVFSFMRKEAKQLLFVAVNRSDSPRSFWLPSNLNPGNGSFLLGNLSSKNKLPAKDFVIMSFPQSGQPT